MFFQLKCKILIDYSFNSSNKNPYFNNNCLCEVLIVGAGGNGGLTSNSGGGGGPNNRTNGNGGSGAVIISVPTVRAGSASNYASTGTNGSNTWWKWTSSGSYTA
jgi:hypothetical protein